MSCPDCKKPDCDGCGMLSRLDAIYEIRKAEGWYRLNGCHNKPRPAPGRTLIVQDGYTTHNVLRAPRYVEIPDVFDASVCQKGALEPDSGCVGCVHVTAKK